MATATLLPASLRNCLEEIIGRSNRAGAGIRVILLSTTEGVPLGRVYGGDQPLNEDVLAAIESVWAPASKQFPVLGLEKLHQVTAIYDHGTLIHVYQAPVVRFSRPSRKTSVVRAICCAYIISNAVTVSTRSSRFSVQHRTTSEPSDVPLFRFSRKYWNRSAQLS